MPQPFKFKAPSNATVSYAIAGSHPFQEMPALAPLYATAITSWSCVETSMMAFFTLLMGGQKELATAIFLSLETQSAKSRAIDTAAANVLSVRQHKAVSILLRYTKSRQKHRNKLAHWLCGASPEVSDSIVFIDPRKFLKGSSNREHALIYKKEDFENIILENESLAVHWYYIEILVDDSQTFDEKNKVCDEITRLFETL